MSTPVDALALAIERAGHPPCDRCEHRRRCAVEHLACRRFAAWAHDGQPHPELPTEPTATTWRRLFEDEP